MDKRSRQTAERFSIINKVETLENELLAIGGIKEVVFDLSGFYDDLNEVIFLVKYGISVAISDYYKKRKELVENVLCVANRNGLERTGDRIEDYGEHLYFVFSCGNRWK